MASGSERSSIAAGPNGKFVVITPDKLMLYSDETQPLKELNLPLSTEALYDHWGVFTSRPGGKYLTVAYESRLNDRQAGIGGVQLKLIETESLQVIRAWTEKDLHCWQISDGGTVLERYQISEPGGPSRYLCQGVEPYCGGLVSFMSNQALVCHVPTNWISLISTHRELLMDRDFSPTREIVDWWATSADGERLALAVDRLRGGSAVLDIGPTFGSQSSNRL